MSDTVRVHLDDDYYEHEFFSDQPEPWWDKDPERAAKVEGVYELPCKQVERWRAAGEAWEAAQGEMRALMAERCRHRIAASSSEKIAREQAERGQAEVDAQAEARRRERLAEIRRGLYGGRQR